jgi:hypothetical protein
MLRPRIVRDEVEVLAVRGCDAEGLLHETVRLVSIALRFAIVTIIIATTT